MIVGSQEVPHVAKELSPKSRELSPGGCRRDHGVGRGSTRTTETASDTATRYRSRWYAEPAKAAATHRVRVHDIGSVHRLERTQCDRPKRTGGASDLRCSADGRCSGSASSWRAAGRVGRPRLAGVVCESQVERGVEDEHEGATFVGRGLVHHGRVARVMGIPAWAEELAIDRHVASKDDDRVAAVWR